MEVLKKHIRTNRYKGQAFMQMTLDDDFNVPDVRPDMEHIVEKSGVVKINHVQVDDRKVYVRGRLEFAVLYVSTNEHFPLNHMEGAVEFDELVPMECVVAGDDVKVSWDMEDLSTHMINSRKLGIRSIIGLTLNAGSVMDIEAVDKIEKNPGICTLGQSVDVSQIHIRKKDTFRIRNEIALPGNKPNMKEILWKNAAIEHLEVKLLDDKICLRGELNVFVLYASEEEKNPLQFMNSTIRILGELECRGAKEEMFGDIRVKIAQCDIEAKKDGDLELRNINVEATLELDIAVYEEVRLELLKDAYGLKYSIVPHIKDVETDRILLKNQSDVRLNHKMKVNHPNSGVLQICQSVGHVKVDRTEIKEDGIAVEGVVYVQIMYVAEDDRMPVGAIKGVLPFSSLIEIPGIDEQCIYEVQPMIDQLGCTMTGSDEIEIKLHMLLSTLVFRREHIQVIEDVHESDEMSPDKKIPAYIGYVAKSGDNLWSIAKRFVTTRENIIRTNGLENENIIPGQKLVIDSCCNNCLDFV